MEVVLPAYVKKIISYLTNAGFEAYAVGGCVRDSLMGREIHDWDITTSALPQETEAVFSGFRIVETGLKHGTVTLICKEGDVEITTFRVDGSYSDYRHPDEVRFTGKLSEDLFRRDFTMNAMAYNDTIGLIDPFGGRQDIADGVIRSVGKAEKRFTEDALRILRAMRFASVLQMQIAGDTSVAMHALCALVGRVSVERIASEINKMLMGASVYEILMEYSDIMAVIIPEIRPMIGFLQYSPHHDFDVWKHTALVVGRSEPIFPVRLAALFHDIGKPQTFTRDETGRGHFYGHSDISAEMCNTILRRMHYDNGTIERVSLLIKHHSDVFDSGDRYIKRLLGKLGMENIILLAKLRLADTLGKYAVGVEDQDTLESVNRLIEKAREIVDSGECFSKKDLAIGGAALIACGIEPGREMGEMLSDVLNAVIEGRIENTRKACLGYLGLIEEKRS